MAITDSHKEIFNTYTRPILHMRQQIEYERFGFVLGAGLSMSFGLPSWNDLVNSIAKDSRINGENIFSGEAPRGALSYKTEMLYQHFKKKELNGNNTGNYNDRKLEYQVAGKWIDIVREHLYKNSPDDIVKAAITHPYLMKLLPIIKKSPLTVTYNFDDYIEQTITHTRSEEERKESKGYETITNPWIQFKRKKSIIYHPNGVVPSVHMEAPTDRIVFSEASFADQLIGQSTGDNAGLLNHLSKNTCMLIGLSLEDESLRSLLVQSARTNPGNYHYYVMYTGENNLDEKHQEAIINTNFKVYNLITLFLGDQEIALIADLLNENIDDLCDFAAKHNIDLQYRYYMTGPLGVGKSTSINYMRNLIVYDEWLETRLPILGKPWDQLTAEEKQQADDWIVGQFELKNTKLRRQKEGIFLIDRGPLDPLAFTPENEKVSKAKRLKEAYSPGQSNHETQSGMLIFLVGDSEELEIRMRLTGRDNYDATRLERMREDLIDVYGNNNLNVVNTKGLTVDEVVRKVAEIVHLEEYVPTDLHKRLESHIDGSLKNGDMDNVQK